MLRDGQPPTLAGELSEETAPLKCAHAKTVATFIGFALS
jgi:hypothetical protein